ncbi:hypothetical protein GC207_02890 [bacterium]|nr:hypothetical protein [bacterium]
MSNPTPHHRIEIRIRELKQLFNSMDPSPFLEKDLDADAEQFIVESAEEYPLNEPVDLVVHLANPADESDPQHLVLTAVHHYFNERAVQARLAFRRLMRQGQWSLLIGAVFLAVCFTAAEVLDTIQPANRWLLLLREGLIIAGWVAMWRPMEIYLYDWWPLRRKLKLMRKLAHMPIKVLLPKAPPAPPSPPGMSQPTVQPIQEKP